MRTRNVLAVLLFTAVAGGFAAPARAGDTDAAVARALQRADAMYAEQSHARALTLYQEARGLVAGGAAISDAEAGRLELRLADCGWRSRAGTRVDDQSIFDGPRDALRAIIERGERDDVWAEAQESLGDSWWDRPGGGGNWGSAWPHYREALDHWAGHRNIELARRRYLDLVWRMAEPQWCWNQWWGWSHGIPRDILENARTIARRPDDRARAHFLVAMSLRHDYNWSQRRRAETEFAEALKMGRDNRWYDDALYHWAEYLATRGRAILTDDGQWRQEPDYVEAVKRFQQLVTEFEKGETGYYDNAIGQIRRITSPELSASVGGVFMPGSEIEVQLAWRNLTAIDLALYRIDITRDLDPTAAQHQNVTNWVQQINPGTAAKVASWRFETRDAGEHRPGRELHRVEEPLVPGGYLLQATGGGHTVRELVLITDLAIVLKSWPGDVVAYVCDAITGAPVPGARIRLWDYRYTGDKWTGSDEIARSDRDGIAHFKVRNVARSRESAYGTLVAASVDGRQAFALGATRSAVAPHTAWKVYAATDRPAYRPGETVQWKITARTNDGTGYAVPAEQGLRYEIHGPRGKVADGELALNAFGTAWADLELDETMALGEYQVVFSHGGHSVGRATLFRLEEYKLPEFEVTVSTSSGPGGESRAVLVGEPVEVQIEASYYFGGPVANANVELVVYQQPFQHWWRPPRDYPWLYEHPGSHAYGWYNRQQVKRETLTTDQFGRATARFATPIGANQDYQYTIEARVTDSSRREIGASSTIKVTRHRYYAYLTPGATIYRPGEVIEVGVKTVDPNGAPHPVQGTVTVTRQRWVEVWIDPSGREVTGSALREARRRMVVFPPPPPRGSPGWQLQFRGYSSQEILQRTVRTDDAGEATIAFTADDEGYYDVAWQSNDPGVGPVNASASVWVATHASTELGYRSGDIEIIVDRDTFRVGETASIMLSVPTPDRWVLLSFEGDDMHRFELVHVTGTVRLVRVPIERRHVPNVYIKALMVTDARLHADTEEVVVPPAEQFLEVEVTADRDGYEPRDEGTLTVVTRDADGRPVPAEVSLGLVDASVYSIQQDYAGDPREFFYNDRQQVIVYTASSFGPRGYRKIMRADGDAPGQAPMAPEGAEDDGLRDQFEMGRSARAPGAAGNEMRQFAKSELRFEDAAAAPGAPAEPDMHGAPDGGPAVVVRSDFRSTIFWKPDVRTGPDGRAIVPVTYADSLTRWKATARAVTGSSQVGIGTATTRTRKPLIARLQAPRFFTVGDTVTISGVLNNNTDRAMEVTPALVAEGLKITGRLDAAGRPVPETAGPVRIPAAGEARIDWRLLAEHAGSALLRLSARGPEHADAMEKAFTVHDHGIEQFLSAGGKVRGDAVTVALDLPARREGSTTMTVSVTSSMAVAMLDSLPYLVEYPYGCTEQTMSRFLPAVITARTLADMGLSAEDAMSRAFGGIEPAFAAGHLPAKGNLRRLDRITTAGLERLYDFQHADGGWGWWKGGESDHFMTAYVLWGMSLAQQAGVDVRRDAVTRAAAFLDAELVEAERQPDLQAWMVHALAAWHRLGGADAVSPRQQRAAAGLWEQRNRLNAYAKALLALAVHAYGDDEKAKILVRNLENGVTRNDRPDASILIGAEQARHPAVIGLAHWGADRIWWRWSDGPVETTSFVLRALVTIDPGNALVEPVVNWLVKNRRGAQWSNTRDTAIAVLALNDYLRASGELEPAFEYELRVNGATIARRKVTAAEALRAPSRYEIDPKHVRDGENTIEIVRANGEGPIYFTAEAEFFSLEEPVSPAGNEIFVRRDYYKIVPARTLLEGYVFDRIPLADGDYVTSGERVEVVVTVESTNDYEYLVFEDLKPAGLEAVQVRSGEAMYASQLTREAANERFGMPDVAGGAPPAESVRDPGRRDRQGYTGRTRWVHQELRDRAVAVFIDKLPEGVWELRYDLRAEVPGVFHALPVVGHAMYVPELRCNSAEVRLTVEDRPADVAVAGE